MENLVRIKRFLEDCEDSRICKKICYHQDPIEEEVPEEDYQEPEYLFVEEMMGEDPEEESGEDEPEEFEYGEAPQEHEDDSKQEIIYEEWPEELIEELINFEEEPEEEEEEGRFADHEELEKEYEFGDEAEKEYQEEPEQEICEEWPDHILEKLIEEEKFEDEDGEIEIPVSITTQERDIDDDYSFVKVLGEGGFATVQLCRHNFSRELFACKIVSKKNYKPAEVDILRYLSPFPGVIGLQDVYEDEEWVYLVMELCPHGDLCDYMEIGLDLPSESELAIRFRGFMETMCYCHEKGVVHRDVKPDNILLTESKTFVLADFGLATRISKGQSLHKVCGTTHYVAPEMIVGSYTEKVDVWSAGILLYCLLTGDVPFQGDTRDEIYDAILKQEIDFDDSRWMNVSPQAIDLISTMLNKNRFERPSAEEVLRHPWFETVSNTLERKPSSCSNPIEAIRGCGTVSIRAPMEEQQHCCYVI